MTRPSNSKTFTSFTYLLRISSHTSPLSHRFTIKKSMAHLLWYGILLFGSLDGAGANPNPVSSSLDSVNNEDISDVDFSQITRRMTNAFTVMKLHMFQFDQMLPKSKKHKEIAFPFIQNLTNHKKTPKMFLETDGLVTAIVDVVSDDDFEGVNETSRENRGMILHIDYFNEEVRACEMGPPNVMSVINPPLPPLVPRPALQLPWNLRRPSRSPRQQGGGRQG